MGEFRDAVAMGDRRLALEALRDRIAVQIEETRGGVPLAALALRLMECLDELEKLPDPQAISSVDDIAAKRAERLASTGGARDAARRQMGRRPRQRPME